DSEGLTLANAADLKVVQTVTDADGDQDTASINLGANVFFIEDDGPTAGTPGTPLTFYLDESVGSDPDGPGMAAAGTTTVTKDLGTLFTGEGYGTDNAGSTSYSLALSNGGVGSGLFALAASGGKGSEILLYQTSATTISGKVGSDTYFTITVENNAASVDFGKVTFAFGAGYDNIWHGSTASDDDAAGLSIASGETLALRQTVTDADGDSAYADMQLGANVFFIEDDGPEIDLSTIATWDATLNPTHFVANMVNATLADDFSFSGVTDDPYAWSIMDAPGDENNSPADGDGLTWRYADVDGVAGTGLNEIVGSLDGVDLYSLYIDDNGSGTATYHFKLLSAVPGGTLDLDVNDIKAGGPDTNYIDVGALNSTDYVRISGFYDSDSSGTIDLGTEGAPINESNLNVGVYNGNLDANEALSFSLFDSGDAIQDITGISIGTKTAQGFSYSWKAYLDGSEVYSGSGSIGKDGTIVIDQGAGNFFDTVVLFNEDGNAVKIGLSDIEILFSPPDYLLDFDARLTDADGDYEDFGFLIGVDGDGSGGIASPIMAAFTPPDDLSLLSAPLIA
ncbi:DUF5801 repeats-in-toxin domain-containing protein, partial [Novosphingobium mangrovi (ex Huang et al. 2023)]